MKPTPTKELRELREEVKELEGIRDRFREEQDQTEKTNLRLNHIRMALYDSLHAERLELQSRLVRCESRIRCLDVEKQTEQPAKESR